MKSNKIRKMLIQELKKMPIVEVACKRVGIGRATFYCWKKGNEEFAKDIDEAIFEGVLFINDMAESKIILKIGQDDMSATRFWLKHHHPAYSDKIQVSKPPEPEKKELTPEESALLKKAIELNYGNVLNKEPEKVRTVKIDKTLAYNIAS